jgi:hypothetical protein
MLVFTDQPETFCEGHRACAVGTTIYMRGLPPGSRVFDFDPDLIPFPHFSSKDLMGWRRCGRLVGGQAGIEVDYNTATTLCHEAKHVAFGRSHNQ